MDQLPTLMTIEQLAEHLELPYSSAWDYVTAGKFGPKAELPKLGRRYRIPRHRVEAFCRGDVEGAKA